MKILKTASYENKDLSNKVQKNFKIASNLKKKIAQSNYFTGIFKNIYKLLELLVSDLKEIDEVVKNKRILQSEIFKNFGDVKKIIDNLQQNFPDNALTKSLTKIWSGVGMLDWKNVDPKVAANAFEAILSQISKSLNYMDNNEMEAAINMQKVPGRHKFKREEGIGLDNIPVSPIGQPPVKTYPPQTLKGLNKEQGY